MLSFGLHPTVPSEPPKRKTLPKRRRPIATQDGDCSDLDQLDDIGETPSSNGKPAVKSRDIQGLKYLDMIAPLLERLHNEMCDRDKAGNRDLHYDQALRELTFAFAV